MKPIFSKSNSTWSIDSSTSFSAASVIESFQMTQRRAILLFFVITLTYSWTVWALMIASARGMLPFRFPTNFLGSFGPMFGAIVTAAILNGGKGIRELFRPLKDWRFSPAAYLMVLLGPAAGFALCALVVGLWLGMPRMEGLDQFYLVIPLALVILFVGGPLGEEIGWRGFLLPCLLRLYSPLRASLIVAAMWFVWHVPLFWLEGAAQKGNSFVAFATMVLAYSMLFTWLYLNTRGSLLMAVLFHTGINTASYCAEIVFPDASFGGKVEMGFLGISMAAAACVLPRLLRPRAPLTS